MYHRYYRKRRKFARLDLNLGIAVNDAARGNRETNETRARERSFYVMPLPDIFLKLSFYLQIPRFHIIKFTNDFGQHAVSRKWLSMEGKKLHCFWPSGGSQLDAKKAKDPQKIEGQWYEARIVVKTGMYD